MEEKALTPEQVKQKQDTDRATELMLYFDQANLENLVLAMVQRKAREVYKDIFTMEHRYRVSIKQIDEDDREANLL